MRSCLQDFSRCGLAVRASRQVLLDQALRARASHASTISSSSSAGCIRSSWTRTDAAADRLVRRSKCRSASEASRRGDCRARAARAEQDFKQRVASRLRGWHLHNWQTDPFAGGAYSYVAVGGEKSQRTLARPIAGTVFIAGEATDWSGQHATVYGALMSGERAAREVLQSDR